MESLGQHPESPYYKDQADYLYSETTSVARDTQKLNSTHLKICRDLNSLPKFRTLHQSLHKGSRDKNSSAGLKLTVQEIELITKAIKQDLDEQKGIAHFLFNETGSTCRGSLQKAKEDHSRYGNFLKVN